jgi:peptide/nickel transport system substrate-binding protein
MPEAAQGLAALQAGECDLLDPAPQTTLLGDMQVFRQPDSWTQLLFGLLPANGTRPAPFANPAVRQAAALCLDRAAVAQAAGGATLEAYVPAGSPYFNAQAALPAPDPAAAATLLTNAGWVDGDADPATPRTALGAPGYTSGAPLAVSLLVAQDPAQQAAAEAIQQGLASCGFQVTVEPRPAEEVFAPGPQGPIFGRNFDLALIAWPNSNLPPCRLFLSREIPGAYPAYPLGWGGANASGYSRPEYDLACTSALTALPGSPEIAAGYAQAQSLLAQDLPFLPLYWKDRLSAVSAELCGLAAPDGSLAYWKVDEAKECGN